IHRKIDEFGARDFRFQFSSTCAILFNLPTLIARSHQSFYGLPFRFLLWFRKGFTLDQIAHGPCGSLSDFLEPWPALLRRGRVEACIFVCQEGLGLNRDRPPDQAVLKFLVKPAARPAGGRVDRSLCDAWPATDKGFVADVDHVACRQFSPTPALIRRQERHAIGAERVEDWPQYVP